MQLWYWNTVNEIRTPEFLPVFTTVFTVFPLSWQKYFCYAKTQPWTPLTYKLCLSHKKSSLPASCLCDLICVQPPQSTLSSSVVTISRPPITSSLKITNHSFRYSAPHLWNQLSISDTQSHFVGHAKSPFHQHHHFHHRYPSHFHSRLKTHFPHTIATIVFQS